LGASVFLAAFSGATAATATSFIGLKLMAMTKLKMGIIGAIAVATVTTPWMLERQARSMLRENETLLRHDAI
jgi:hypothetical protein